jgi:hypothetical protein
VTTAVFAASIGVAFLGLIPAAVVWLVVLPGARALAHRLRPDALADRVTTAA